MTTALNNRPGHAHPDFARKLLEAEGRLWVSVATQSMTPLLRPGDRVEVQLCAPLVLAPGDIIAIDDGERLLIHRLVLFAPGHFITKGDALPQPDVPQSSPAVLGRVTAVEHGETVRHVGGGWVSALLARYSLFLTRFRLPSSGVVWRFTRIPFYLLTRFE